MTPMSESPIDQSDFMRLFVRHERDLRVFARSLLPNWPAVDDVLQEASVVMWKKLHQLEQEEGFFTWARVIGPLPTTFSSSDESVTGFCKALFLPAIVNLLWS